MKLLRIPHEILENLDVVWTFLLIMVRFTGFFLMVPGLGSGIMGLAVRLPAIIVLSYASLLSSPRAALPPDWGIVVASFFSEVLFGSLIGMVPYLIVGGAQVGGQLAGTSMGLGQAQLIDPTSGGTVPELAKLYGDAVILVFLLLGGHHVAIYAASGFAGGVVPGSFVVSGLSLELLIDRSAEIFRLGMLIAAPVVVALLLTQFVMGLISKVVPSINVFVVSFPITAVIGLSLSIIGYPTVIGFVAKHTTGIETTLIKVAEDAGYFPTHAP